MIQRMFVTLDTKKTNYKNVGKINHGDDLILELTVLSDGDMISFNDPMVDLLVKKSDGKMIRQNSGIERIKPNKFIIEVKKDCVTSPGLSTNQLIINDNGRISTCMFYYTVLNSLEEDVMPSISNVEVLEQLDEFVVQIQDKMEVFDSDLTERMDELTDGIVELEKNFNDTSSALNEAEVKRSEAEQLRAQAEALRVQNEDKRAESENVRVQNESDRAAAELIREQREVERVLNDEERHQNESERAMNELVRQQNESVRQSNESIRMSNENDRKTQENRRVTAETNRVNAETTRRNNENSRISNEIERQKTMNEMKSLLEDTRDFDERVSVIEDEIEEINSSLDNIESQRNITVILNQFSEIAKANTPYEDWSLAFNYVFSNFKKEWCSLKVVFSGGLKVRSTIDIPYGVSIEGSAHPYSQIVPSSDFVGDYVFTQRDNQSHIELKNIYIAFLHNENVGGFYIENPYDYSILENLVGSNTKREFIRIGSPTNSKIGQTLKISNCVCYGNVEGEVPLYAIYNQQEMYFENNKVLFTGRTSSRIGILCDGVATSTFINNSVANCDKIALKISCDLYPKRIVGNLLIGNLFENTVPVNEDDGVIMITSGSGSASEGQNNQIIATHFMNSSDTIKLSNLTNTTVIGVANVSGARRTFHINPYNPTENTDPYGNLQLSADGGYLVGKFKGNLISEDIKTAGVNSKSVSLKPAIGDSNKEIKMYWNASNTDDYGYIIEKENSEILKFYANCWHLSSGAGIKLFSSDKSTSITLGCSNNGKLTVNGVEIN